MDPAHKLPGRIEEYIQYGSMLASMAVEAKWATDANEQTHFTFDGKLHQLAASLDTTVPPPTPVPVLPSAVPSPASALLNALREIHAELCKGFFFAHGSSRQLGLSREPLPQSIPVWALDGNCLGAVSHQTRPIVMFLSGNHHEQIQFYILNKPGLQLILGFPWL